MNTVSKSAAIQLMVSLMLVIGAVLLNWGLDSREIPQLWQAVGVLLGTFWAGWAFTALYNRQADLMLLPLSSALVSLGWLEIVRYFVSKAQPDATMREAVHVAIGMGAFVVVSLLLRDYRVLEGYKYVLLLAGVLFQFSLVFIGREANGAKLWISIGSTGVQPFEFVKILLAIFLAAYLNQFSQWIRLGLTSPKFGRLSRRALLVLGLCIGTAEGLLAAQKDLGMALLLFGLFIA
ncbi:FtsW/RodA/SpoVE family cell cycle protein, partial [bacterium]|nr:FtsW/RodA/SpoVE family cell cycle protein [bacterium]